MDVLNLAIFQAKNAIFSKFCLDTQNKNETKKFSHKKLPQKTHIPKSNTQNWTKVTFFLGHPVEITIYDWLSVQFPSSAQTKQ